MNIALLDDTTCVLCGRDYIHKKYYTNATPIGELKDGIKVCELLLECATCRSILKKKKEIEILFEERRLLAKQRKEQKLMDKWKKIMEENCRN